MSTSSKRSAATKYYARTLVPSLLGSQPPEYTPSTAGQSIISASSSRSASTHLPKGLAKFMFEPGTTRNCSGHEVTSLPCEPASRGDDPNYPDQVPPDQRQHFGHTDDGEYSVVGVQEVAGNTVRCHLYQRPATTGSTRTRYVTSRPSTTGPSQQRLLAPIDEGKKFEILHWTGDVSSKVGTQCSGSNKATSKWEGTVVPDDSISQVTERVGSQQGGGGSGSRRGYKYVNLTAWDWS